MIKLYTTKEILGGGLVVASTDKDEADDIEGYFCTLEELRELFEAGGSYHVEVNDSGGGELENPDFDQWLASKEKAE